MRYLGTLAAIAACHAKEENNRQPRAHVDYEEEANRRLRTHVDYAPLAETNGKLMYAGARGPPEPWSRAMVTAASSNHFRTLVNFVHNYRKQRSGIPLRVAAPESQSTRRRLDGVPVG